MASGRMRVNGASWHVNSGRAPAWRQVSSSGPSGTSSRAGRSCCSPKPPPVLLPAHLRDNPRLGIPGELSDSFPLTGPERRKAWAQAFRAGPDRGVVVDHGADDGQVPARVDELARERDRI